MKRLLSFWSAGSPGECTLDVHGRQPADQAVSEANQGIATSVHQLEIGRLVQPFIAAMQVFALALMLIHHDLSAGVLANLLLNIPALTVGSVLGVLAFRNVSEQIFRCLIPAFRPGRWDVKDRKCESDGCQQDPDRQHDDLTITMNWVFRFFSRSRI